MTTSVVRTRSYKSAGSVPAGGSQAIHDTRFDTVSLSSGVWPSTTKIFAAIPNADPCLANYPSARHLADQGEKFTVYSLAATILPGTSATAADMINVINEGVVLLTIGQKEYGRFRISDLPSGGGAYHPFRTDTTASNVEQFVTNGHPSRKRFAFKYPIEISEQTQVDVTILGPTGTLVTLTGAVRIRLGFEGVFTRSKN